MYGIRSTSTPSTWDEVLAPFEKEANRAFNNIVKGLGSHDFFVKGSYPKCNILDTDDKLIIEAAVPGMTMEDITIELEDSIFSISGKKQERLEGDFLRKELHLSSFRRTFALPEIEQFDVDAISASLSNGILVIEFPRSSSYIDKIKKRVIKIGEKGDS